MHKYKHKNKNNDTLSKRKPETACNLQILFIKLKINYSLRPKIIVSRQEKDIHCATNKNSFLQFKSFLMWILELDKLKRKDGQ